MIALDTNLLLYAHDPGAPENLRAQAALTTAAGTGKWGIALGSVTEFWSVATRAGTADMEGRRRAATVFLRRLSESGAAFWRPGLDFAERLVRMATENDTVGTAVFDLQIALTALDNGAEQLWTHDRRFPAVPGLQIVDPL